MSYALTTLPTLRKCVRRWKRCPTCILTDRGPGFKEGYAKAAVSMGVRPTWRPAGMARGAPQVERCGGVSNQRIAAELRGHTGILAKYRRVSQSHDPALLAVYCLSEHNGLLERYFYETYDQLPHGGLNNRSPRDMREMSLKRDGERKHLEIEPDRFTIPHKGEGARQIVAAVEVLTMRTGLERTSLLRTEKFSCVLVSSRQHRAWCARCLKADEVPYEPLIWNVADVTHCSTHGTELIDRCPTCRRRQHFGAVGASIDHCQCCGSSLSDTNNDSALLPDDYRAWMARETARFLANIDDQQAVPGVFAQNIKVTMAACGGRRPLSRLLQVALNSLRSWEHGRNRMRLEVALRWAWVTSVPLGDLMCRSISESELKLRPSQCEWRPMGKAPSRKPTSKRYLTALAGILAKQPYVVPTKRMLLRQVGGSQKHPALNTPEVCQALESSKKSRKQLRYKQRVWAIVCRVRQAFAKLQASGLPVNSYSLCIQLGGGGDMVSPLARKYFSVLKQQYSNGHPMPDPNKRVPLDVREFWAHHGLT